MRRRLILGFGAVIVLGAVIAVIAVAGRGTPSDEGFACTLVGCDSGTSIQAPDLAYAPADVTTIEVCIAGRCQRRPRAVAGPALFFREVDGSAPVQVSAALIDPRGRAITRDQRRVARARSAPNGELCGPICYTGGVRLEPDGRLQTPPPRVRLPRPGRPRAHVIAGGHVSRLEAGCAPSRSLTIRPDDPIEIRTDSRSYVRVYAPGAGAGDDRRPRHEVTTTDHQDRDPDHRGERAQRDVDDGRSLIQRWPSGTGGQDQRRSGDGGQQKRGASKPDRPAAADHHPRRPPYGYGGSGDPRHQRAPPASIRPP